MRDNLLMAILGLAFFSNLLAVNLFPPVFEGLLAFGFFLLALGGLLVVLSILTLARQGTGRLIDHGLYGLVRHPMYLGGLLLFLSHPCFSQHWLVLLSTAIALACCHALIKSADQRNLEKFGPAYQRYMRRVPGINLFSGLLQLRGKRLKARNGS